jgi:hydroxymethylbilane synthase
MRLGTRRSALALAQAQLVAGVLGDCEIVPISTSGDSDAPAEDKSRWVDELERALLDGRIDLAVHSAKDVPGKLAEGLSLLGTLARGPVEDALCGAAGLDALPSGARVGTSSVRRIAQLRAEREDLEIVPIRGNVDTRLRKLADEELDAIVLASAGLRRLERASEIGALLDAARFVPAPGQGTLALEGRLEDERARGVVERVSDGIALTCLLAERALARELDADCHTPLGAHCAPADGRLRLRAWFGAPDGSAWVSDELLGEEPLALGRAVAERMRVAGVAELVAR